MLVKRPHRNLAMKFQIGRQYYIECCARDNRRNGVLYIYPVKYINRLLWIRARRWKRVCRTELITLGNASARVDPFGAGAHLNGNIGRRGTADRIGQIFPNQIAHRRGCGSRCRPCRTTLSGVLHAHSGCSRKGQHHEPKVAPIDDIEGKPKQERQSHCRFEQALSLLTLKAALAGQSSMPHTHFSAACAAIPTRSNSMVSPTSVEVDSNMPDGSSSTAAAFQNIRVIRNGRMSRLMAMTLHSLSRTAMSMGNCIPKVCTPCEGTISSPSPRWSSRSPSKPTIRVSPVSATRIRWPTTVPRVAFVARTAFFCHRIATSPRPRIGCP